MIEHIDSIVSKLRIIVVSLLIIACLFLLSVLLTSIGTASRASQNQSATSSESVIATGTYGSPNAVTSGLSAMVTELGHATSSADKSIGKAARTVGTTLAQGGMFMLRGAYTGVSLAAYGVGASVSAVVGTFNGITGFVSNTAVVSAVIQPSARAQAPIIDPYAPNMYASRQTIPAVAIAAQAQPSAPAPGATWPIHGIITTNFGVPHWPFQPTHTGLDISSGNRSGVIHIKPFKPGTVIEASWSSNGLGNHVVIDHGGGMTSVYGHMYAISVQQGQHVDLGTTLGTEGSTGASTGTHLHLEIRLNGVAVDPRPYLPGNP